MNVGGDKHAINFDREKLLELSGTGQRGVEENNVGKKAEASSAIIFTSHGTSLPDRGEQNRCGELLPILKTRAANSSALLAPTSRTTGGIPHTIVIFTLVITGILSLMLLE
jgi:hypothetical protein